MRAINRSHPSYDWPAGNTAAQYHNGQQMPYHEAERSGHRLSGLFSGQSGHPASYPAIRPSGHPAIRPVQPVIRPVRPSITDMRSYRHTKYMEYAPLCTYIVWHARWQPAQADIAWWRQMRVRSQSHSHPGFQRALQEKQLQMPQWNLEYRVIGLWVSVVCRAVIGWSWARQRVSNQSGCRTVLSLECPVFSQSRCRGVLRRLSAVFLSAGCRLCISLPSGAVIWDAKSLAI